MIGAGLIALLAFLLIVTLPSWSYSRNWGYYLISLLGTLLSLALILELLDRF